MVSIYFTFIFLKMFVIILLEIKFIYFFKHDEKQNCIEFFKKSKTKCPFAKLLYLVILPAYCLINFVFIGIYDSCNTFDLYIYPCNFV